jgi:2-phospho-L-lactate guanylyltransferase
VILVPVKNIENAKERLSPVLDSLARRELAKAMLEDVLEAVAGLRRQADIALVTSDAYATRLAQQHRFEIIPDPINRSETDAIAHATELSVAGGASWTLVIPADIPLVKSSDLEQILAKAPLRGSLLVPGWDGCGTNAVFRRPGDLFSLQFGNESFKPHLRAAQARGECIVLQMERVGLDVDSPGDLARLLTASGKTRTQRLLRQWQSQHIQLAAS